MKKIHLLLLVLLAVIVWSSAAYSNENPFGEDVSVKLTTSVRYRQE